MSRKISDTEAIVDEIIDYEKVRYVNKGYGLISAFLITIGWFFILPQLSYYIWPTKIEEPGKFTFFLNYITHEISFIFVNVAMWVIYKLEWDFFERYKSNDKPWPWKKDPEAWNKLVKETIILLALNHLVILPLVSCFSFITNVSPFRVDYESLPTVFEVIWQTVFFMIMDDLTFYWSHRFLHWNKIYPYIHKIHHKYINTVSIASEYAHPLEFAIGNVLTANSGPLLLGRMTHQYTVVMWIILRIAETTDGHSGYEFSWSPFRLLPMSGSSEYHNFHHLNFKGNYSSFFTYLDKMFGTTNNAYMSYIRKKKDLIEKQIEKDKEIKKD